VQTEYEISTLYEGFEGVYKGIHNLSEKVDLRIGIQKSMKTNTTLITFEDVATLKRIKFSLYQKDSPDQYVVHSECAEISESHHIMVTVEQI
jgi:hypothetical protein